jgi:hypothetical protein
MKKFCCGENKCFRIFSSIDAFKKHVRSHVLPLDKAKNSNEQLTVVQNTDNGDTFENPIVNLNSAIPSYHEPVSFNITEFQDELHSNIIHFMSEMYNNSLIPRNFIQFIVSEVKKIFCDKTIPHLKNITTHLMKNSNCS